MLAAKKHRRPGFKSVQSTNVLTIKIKNTTHFIKFDHISFIDERYKATDWLQFIKRSNFPFRNQSNLLTPSTKESRKRFRNYFLSAERNKLFELQKRNIFLDGAPSQLIVGSSNPDYSLQEVFFNWAKTLGISVAIQRSFDSLWGLKPQLFLQHNPNLTIPGDRQHHAIVQILKLFSFKKASDVTGLQLETWLKVLSPSTIATA